MLIDDTRPEETHALSSSTEIKLKTLNSESANRKQIKGNIYLAKVMRVEPSLQAAFVDYGGNKHGFLAFGEIHPDYYHVSEEELAAIDKKLMTLLKPRNRWLKSARPNANATAPKKQPNMLPGRKNEKPVKQPKRKPKAAEEATAAEETIQTEDVIAPAQEEVPASMEAAATTETEATEQTEPAENAESSEEAHEGHKHPRKKEFSRREPARRKLPLRMTLKTKLKQNPKTAKLRLKKNWQLWLKTAHLPKKPFRKKLMLLRNLRPTTIWQKRILRKTMKI